MGEEPAPRNVPQGYKELLPVWNRLAISLQATYVVLGVMATVSSLAVATFTAELGPIRVKEVSFILAISLGLITAFDIGAKANASRGAWRLLNAATLAYANDPSFTIQDLYKQYLAGEALLGDIKYNAPAVKPTKPTAD
jgi:hypothetical protein